MEILEGGEYVLLCSCGEHSRIEVLLALRIYETKPHPIKTYLGVSNSGNLVPIVMGRYVKPGPRTFWREIFQILEGSNIWKNTRQNIPIVMGRYVTSHQIKT